MNDFVRVLVKADTVLRLPRNVADNLVRQGLAEYETALDEQPPAETSEPAEE